MTLYVGSSYAGGDIKLVVAGDARRRQQWHGKPQQYGVALWHHHLPYNISSRVERRMVKCYAIYMYDIV